MSINIEEYIYAQYQNAPIANIVRNLQAIFDKDSEQFLIYLNNALLNIKTADIYGLACWGDYLSESKIYDIKLPTDNKEWFGYTKERLNFIGNFGDKSDSITIILDDETYRKKLIMEAYLRWTTLDLVSINNALLMAFNGGVVVDCTFYDAIAPVTISPMTCFFYIHEKINPTIDFLARNGLFLPTPAGVGIAGLLWDDTLYNGLFNYDGKIHFGEE